MKKILYVILDGLGDQPIPELQNQTPLEIALTPHLDRLAQTGQSGLIYPVAPGIAPESDIAVISLLGYEVAQFYTGRGPLEAFAEGLAVHEGDLALRVNFATCGADGLTIKDRRVGRNLSTEEASYLAKEINSQVTLSSATFEFKNTIGHRGVLVIHGMRGRLCGWITNTDPAYARQGVFGVAKERFLEQVIPAEPMPGYETSLVAQEAAALLNEFTQKSQQVLNNSAINKKRISENKLPANLILCRDAGDRLPRFPQIEEIFHLKFGCFVQMPVERGIALLSGMEIIAVPSSTGHLDVDYPVWAKIALDALAKYEGIYLHIKGPDEPGHDGDFLKKKEIIESIDKFFFGSLLKELELANTIICVTADHSTASQKKAHSADPVPVLISGANLPTDGSMSFSEKAAALGSLGHIRGQELLALLVKLAKQ